MPYLLNILHFPIHFSCTIDYIYEIKGKILLVLDIHIFIGKKWHIPPWVTRLASVGTHEEGFVGEESSAGSEGIVSVGVG